MTHDNNPKRDRIILRRLNMALLYMNSVCDRRDWVFLDLDHAWAFAMSRVPNPRKR